ncbi:CLUMA_CG000215, isoform A [Clunio marinus]|uniref:CLUMA_CG000215, isoform A n=1 Tax=Clunio marinus TaxID=568069 RepID=A0A1J1HFA8_9DIPT|nr:CLUMA_CG000215, isoform A [Clunio marinus]
MGISTDMFQLKQVLKIILLQNIRHYHKILTMLAENCGFDGPTTGDGNFGETFTSEAATETIKCYSTEEFLLRYT